jgi:hypothetical protein
MGTTFIVGNLFFFRMHQCAPEDTEPYVALKCTCVGTTYNSESVVIE